MGSSPARARTMTSFRCNGLFQCLMCRCGGVQSNHVAEQHVTSLANYVSNVRQAGHVSYVS